MVWPTLGSRTAKEQNRGQLPARMTYPKSKLLPKPHGSLGGADLRFSSPQLECQTSAYSALAQCEIVGLVHRTVCLFTFQVLCQQQIILLGNKGI